MNRDQNPQDGRLQKKQNLLGKVDKEFSLSANFSRFTRQPMSTGNEIILFPYNIRSVR